MSKKFTDQAMKQSSKPAGSMNQEEVNRVKSKKIFGCVITARQDGWVKMIMATGGSSVISVVRSTIFSVLALIT